jgi:hypothetical protein
VLNEKEKLFSFDDKIFFIFQKKIFKEKFLNLGLFSRFMKNPKKLNS